MTAPVTVAGSAGGRLVLETYEDLPLFDFRVVIPGGTSDDPIGREGLAHHAAELVRRGTAKRTRAQLDDAVDAIGASLVLDAGVDTVMLTGHALARHADALVALGAEVLAAPAMDQLEHEKLRREELASLDQLRDDDESLAWRFFLRAALAGHPYGRTSIGTEASLSALSVDEARAWATRTLVREHAIVGLAGALPPDAAERLAAPLRAALADRPTTARAVKPVASPPAARRTLLIDKPERTQSQIVIGHRGPPTAHADWLPLHVACAIFGGGFTSRLMTEVRVKRGWSYGASARIVRAQGSHALTLRFAPSAEQTADTLVLVQAMWEALVAHGVTADELAFVKSYLEGRWAFDIDTAPKRLDDRIDALILGTGDPATMIARLRALEVDEVNGAIARWMHPDRAITSITCSALELEPRLRALPLGEIDVLAYDSY